MKKNKIMLIQKYRKGHKKSDNSKCFKIIGQV